MRFVNITFLQLAFFIFLSSCIGGGGYISLDGDVRPEVIPLDEGNDCVNYDVSENEEENLYEAAKSREDNAMFFEWLDQLCEDDTFYCERLRGADGPHTLLLPTNEAVKRFIEEYPEVVMEGITLRAIVKYHTLVSPVALTEFHAGSRRTMNRELVPVSVEDPFCIYFGDNQAHLRIANDECSNGYIHTINKVLIPNRNFK